MNTVPNKKMTPPYQAQIEVINRKIDPGHCQKLFVHIVLKLRIAFALHCI